MYRFSNKQKEVLNWWKESDYSGIICDGAIRSGKTFSMSLSFIQWACSNYKNKSFAVCGKSIKSIRRNVVLPLFSLFREYRISYKESKSSNFFQVEFLGHKNIFYLFGGYDESSAAHIQGLTLAGVLFDEVALMPESFVLQAIARCSVKKSKFWFNCNPENPYHWFYKKFIKKSVEKSLLYLHFTMEDNPSLSKEVKNRYKSLYSGSFYRRFIKGEWTTSEGLIYPNFGEKNIYRENIEIFEKYYLSCDYGTINPTSIGLWGLYEGNYYRIKEYYYNNKELPRTDNQHYKELLKLTGKKEIEKIIVDPSAASFIQVIKNNGKFRVEKAQNDVENGIRRVQNALESGRIKISFSCKDAIEEFAQYRWKSNTQKAEPVKTMDHSMDDIRYFVSNILSKEKKEIEDFFVLGLSREEEC